MFVLVVGVRMSNRGIYVTSKPTSNSGEYCVRLQEENNDEHNK